MDTENSPLFSYEQLHSSLNHRLTKSLFVEVCPPDATPIMTLRRATNKDLVVLRDIFIPMVAEDPTEYEFAEYVFGDYAFWDNLSKATWIQPHLEEWRMVADVRRKSEAFGTLVRDARGKGPSAPSSAKYVIEEKWKDKRKKAVRESSKKTSDTAAQGYSEDVARLKDYMQ